MLLTLAFPAALDIGGVAHVRLLHAGVGDYLAVGAAIMDFSVDLSAGTAHDCPPIAHYRLVLRDKAWLRRLAVGVGDIIDPAAIGWLTTDVDEPLDGQPSRPARVTVASIVFHAPGWGGRP